MNTRTTLVRLMTGWNFPERRGFNFDCCFVLHGSIILYLSALSRANFIVFRLLLTVHLRHYLRCLGCTFADCTFKTLPGGFRLYTPHHQRGNGVRMYTRETRNPSGKATREQPSRHFFIVLYVSALSRKFFSHSGKFFKIVVSRYRVRVYGYAAPPPAT